MSELQLTKAQHKKLLELSRIIFDKDKIRKTFKEWLEEDPHTDCDVMYGYVLDTDGNLSCDDELNPDETLFDINFYKEEDKIKCDVHEVVEYYDKDEGHWVVDYPKSLHMWEEAQVEADKWNTGEVVEYEK